jgi:hypothetical protein
MVLQGSRQHAQTRFLLALWDLSESQGKSNATRGAVMPRAKRSKETSGDFDAIIEDLVSQGAIAVDGKSYTLQPFGKQLLSKCLLDSEFEYDSNVGAKTVNTLLQWIRQQGSVAVPSMNGSSNGQSATPISSYEQFTQVALETYEELNRDYNMDNLVPIYRIRRQIGDQVSRSQFDEWLLKMQADDIFQLQGGSLPDNDPNNLEDSITTELSGLRCYAQRLA